MFHHMNITISTEIISKCNEVSITNPSSNAHWATYIRMYKAQQVIGPSINLVKKGPLSFCPTSQIHRFQMISNQMSPKGHLLESLNPFLIDMAQMTMPEISGVQVIRF